MTATHWWVLVPQQAEENTAGVVADAFIVSVAAGSAADNQLLSNYTGKVTIAGKSGYLRAGPFSSLAAAQSYLKTGAQTAPLGTVPGLSVSPGGQLTASNPLSALAPIGAFFAALSQANTWIRVAKVLAGGLLLIIGLAHMTGAGNAVATAARKVPVPV